MAILHGNTSPKLKEFSLNQNMLQAQFFMQIENLTQDLF